MTQEISNKIETATNTIKSIPEFLDAIAEVMQTPYGWVVLAVFLIWFLLNKDLSNVIRIFESKEKKRLGKLEVYVGNKDAANVDVLEVIKDLRDAHYFKVATDIYAEKNLRDSLIALHKLTSHSVSWINIKRAMTYLVADTNSKITVRKQTKLEVIGHYYNIATGWLLLGFAVALLLVFLFSTTKNFSQFSVWILSSVSCAFFAMFAFSQNWPIASAKKIADELEAIKRSAGSEQSMSADEENVT